MHTILLSIKPKYVKDIFKGLKIYEIRKSKPSKLVSKILIYETHPISKIVGEFEVEIIIEETIEQLWNLTRKFNSLSKKEFNDYFSTKKTGYAYKIKHYEKYKNAMTLKDFNIKAAPQNFVYINNSI